jgi:hypothetical protein
VLFPTTYINSIKIQLKHISSRDRGTRRDCIIFLLGKQNQILVVETYRAARPTWHLMFAGKYLEGAGDAFVIAWSLHGGANVRVTSVDDR